MRLFDLILAIAILWGLVLIAEREFPGYARRTIAPAPTASPTPAPATS